MAGTKIVVKKLARFKGRDEEFSNVYYFGDGTADLSPSAEVAKSLVEAVIAEEKKVHGNTVRFLGGAAYHVGVRDTPGDTDAIASVELLAAGNQGAFLEADNMYRECAVDIKFLLGGRRYLRTMLHTMVAHGLGITGKDPQGVAGLSAEIKAYAGKMLSGPWPGGFNRIAPNGDRPSAIEYNPFLEHRQFHRYRNRNAGLLG